MFPESELTLLLTLSPSLVYFAFHQFFPCPTWISATIQYTRDQDFILKELVINGEWKPLREKSMVPEDNTMDASEI